MEIGMKSTDELMHEILDSEQPDYFFQENQDEFRDLSLSAFLKSMLQSYGVTKAELFRKAGQSGSNYAYELFRNDKKAPSRDILLTLCLAFPMTIEETQTALRCAGLSVLYPRDKRDAYIMFALKNKMSIEALDELLEKQCLKTFI